MADNSILSKGIRLYEEKSYTDSLAYFLSLPTDGTIDSIESAYYIGLCYSQLERYEDAMLYLEQVVTSCTDQERVLQCRFLLAVIYCLSGRKRLSEFELQKLLETGYRKASVYAAMAFIAWQNKNTDEAIDLYEKALACDEDNVTALNGLGYILAEENRELTKALSYCKKAVQLEPNSAACLDSLGWIYYKLGLRKDALSYLSQAARLAGNNEEIAEHLHIAETSI